MDTGTVALKSSCSGMQLEMPDSPLATPACDPLPCLTSLCHSLLLSGALILPSAFCQGLLLHPTGQESTDDGIVGPGEPE